MEVQVRHGLAAFFVAVDHQAVAFLQSVFSSQAGGDQMHVAQELLVLFSQIGVRANFFARNQQDMHRGLRGNVPKRQAEIVFLDNLCWNFSLDDFQEDIVG
jgi:hypothetical protein